MGPQRRRILLLDGRSAIIHALGRRMRAAGHVVHTLPSSPSGEPVVVLSAPAVPEFLEDQPVETSHDVSPG